VPDEPTPEQLPESPPSAAPWPPPAPPPGYPQQYPPAYPPPAYPQGYPQQPYPQQPYPPQEYPQQPYPPQEYPQQHPGYPPYPPPGYGPPAGYQGYPAYQVPYAKPPKPSFPHDRPRPYHQMLRNWDYAPWRSVVGILIVLLGFILVVPLLALPILIVGVAFQPGDFLTNFERAGTLQEITPAGMLYLNVSIGGAILVTWLAIRVMHGMRPRWLASVMPKLRWKFLFVCLGLSVVALGASLIVGAVLPSGGTDSGLGGSLNSFTADTAWIALIVLLTTPFQAAGEEYVFRGYLLQAVGSFVERPWWRWFTILSTAFLFACAHLQFSPPIFFDRFAFGVVAAWVAIRTGGLEAGIALHILNNYLAFGVALAFGNITESLNAPEASWWNIFSTLTQSLVYAGLVAYAARRMNLRNVTQPPVYSVVEPDVGASPRRVETN
jgi:uncharacterized protein